VRNRQRVWRGCPVERETHFQCGAYKENGRLCQKPANNLDPQRGCFVCDAHHAINVAKLKQEQTEAQAA